MLKKMAQYASFALMASGVFHAGTNTAEFKKNKAENDAIKLEIKEMRETLMDDDYKSKQEAAEGKQLLYDDDGQMQLFERNAKGILEQVTKNNNDPEYIAKVRAVQQAVEARTEYAAAEKEHVGPILEKLDENAKEITGNVVGIVIGSTLFLAGAAGATAAGRRREDEKPETKAPARNAFRH